MTSGSAITFDDALLSTQALRELSERLHREGRLAAASTGVLGSLPLEVLSNVFYWCCATYDDEFPIDATTPLHLSHVCKLWREVVFNTPCLWTFLRLYTDTHALDDAIELLRLWMSKVKNCPISIDVTFTDPVRYNMADNVLFYAQKFILEAMIAKPSLIQEDMHLRAAVDAIDYESEDDLPVIRERYCWNNLDLFGEAGTVEIRSSRLCTVLYGLEGHMDLAQYLVHLDLRDNHNINKFSIEETSIVLSMFYNLEYCALHIEYSFGDEELETYSMERLKTLHFTWGNLANISPLLDFIEAPVLENLKLGGHLPIDDTAVELGHRWNNLFLFLTRNRAPLRSLELVGMDCNALNLIGCIAQCRLLKRLWLENCILGKPVVLDLVQQRHPSSPLALRILSALKSLGLVSCSIYNFENLFQDMCTNAELWEDTALDDLYIYDCGQISQESLDNLQRVVTTRYEIGPIEEGNPRVIAPRVPPNSPSGELFGSLDEVD